MGNTLVEGETVVEVGSYYETLSNKNVVTDQETDAAVAEISHNNFHHGMDQSTTGSVTNYEASYVSIANEEESTTASSHSKNVTKPVSIIQLQQPLKSNSSNIVNQNTEEGSAEHLDFFVETVNELENNKTFRLPSTTHSTMVTVPTNITSLRSASRRNKPATFVVLAPNSTLNPKSRETETRSLNKSTIKGNE